MKFAFPRQRECHNLKRTLLNPEDFNKSIDLTQLKKESLRISKQNINASSQIKNSYFLQGQSEIFNQLGSEQLSAVNSRADDARGQALNSASTMPEAFMLPTRESGMVLAESSLQTMGGGSIENADNKKSGDSLM